MSPHTFSSVQLFEFCNYAYEPVTEIVELTGEKAEELIVSIQ